MLSFKWTELLWKIHSQGTPNRTVAGQRAITADSWEFPGFPLHAASKWSHGLSSHRGMQICLCVWWKDFLMLSLCLLTLTYHIFLIGGAILPHLLRLKKLNSLVAWWLRILGFHCYGPGWILGWGTEIPQAERCGQNKKRLRKLQKSFILFCWEWKEIKTKK